MIRKNISFFVIVVFMISLVACSTSNKSGKNSDDSLQMPDIVFMCHTDFSEVSAEEEIQYSINFIDKNGNQYSSNDTYVGSLNYKELITEFAEGNISDKIILHTTYDVNELTEKYNLLRKVAENKEYEIIYPDYDFEWQHIRTNWYGFFWDEDGEVGCIKLHCKDGNGNHDSNDDRANELYQWYIGK